MVHGAHGVWCMAQAGVHGGGMVHGMVYGVRCMAYGAWRAMYAGCVWCMVYGVWCGVWCMVLVYGVWCMVFTRLKRRERKNQQNIDQLGSR
jgi:hypothetical protein